MQQGEPQGEQRGQQRGEAGLGLRMHAERTPNPNSIKWVLAESLVETTANFETPPSPQTSPLASALFEIDGVEGVFFAANFATVSKRDEVDWVDIAQPIVDALKTHLDSGRPALGPDFEPATAVSSGELVTRICRMLDDEIRPSVALDGGDIAFVAYRDGVVELQMRGACSGCPSSTATLKLAIEARIREQIPEVQQVVAV